MPLYISFNDSSNDPTYIDADCAMLVDSPGNGGYSNPCVHKDAQSVSVLPSSEIEIRAFADMLGWAVETDNEGQLVIYTGKYKSE